MDVNHLADLCDDTPKHERTATMLAARALGVLDAEVKNGGWEQWVWNCAEDDGQFVAYLLENREGVLARVSAMVSYALDNVGSIKATEDPEVTKQLDEYDQEYYAINSVELGRAYLSICGKDVLREALEHIHVGAHARQHSDKWAAAITRTAHAALHGNEHNEV